MAHLTANFTEMLLYVQVILTLKLHYWSNEQGAALLTLTMKLKLDWQVAAYGHNDMNGYADQSLALSVSSSGTRQSSAAPFNNKTLPWVEIFAYQVLTKVRVHLLILI